MQSINLTNYIDRCIDKEVRYILTCEIRLDKKTILEILQCDIITLNGIHYEVPEAFLLSCLVNKRFGPNVIELVEKID
jgi:hypothetical protein